MQRENAKKYVYLTETQYIHYNTKQYEALDYLSHIANNIYNAANYIVRQHLFNTGELLNYQQLNKILKDYQARNQTNLYNKVSVQFTQQILMKLMDNWKTWWRSRQEYIKNPNKFHGRPQIPNYRDKGQRMTFYFSNQMFKLQNNHIIFATKKSNGDWKKNTKKWQKTLYQIKMGHHSNKIQQITVVPVNYGFKFEIIYLANHEKVPFKEDNHKWLGIDPGLDNFMTVVNTTCKRPIIIDGKPLKTINQYANKKLATLKKELTINHQLTSHRISRLLDKRSHKIEDYMHKASNRLVSYAISCDISKIIIGNGATNSKNSMSTGRKNNQNFINIPHGRFIKMITYKAAMHGIEVIQVEESYSSQSSFLDRELPIAMNGNKYRKEHGDYKRINRRIKRGLYKTDNNKYINADVNGAYQIIKKAYPSFNTWNMEGLRLIPLKKITM